MGIFRTKTRIEIMFRNIVYGISNIFKWLPIIWKDRDWDHGYLYDLLYFKLNNMQKFFESENVFSCGAKKCAERIKVCKLLVKRLEQDDYWELAGIKPVEFFKKFKMGDMEHMQYLQKQDKEMLFKMLNKYIDNWWD